MNITKLTEEQIRKLPRSQLLELLRHTEKWILPTLEVQRRNELVVKTIRVWRYAFPHTKDFLTEDYSRVWPMLDLAIYLKPIKDEWLDNFIKGLVCSNSKQLEDKEKAIKLKRPVFIVLAHFMSTKYYQEYFIERSIPESEMIIAEINSYVKITVNARDAVKSLAEQKRLVLFNTKQIRQLKLEYLLEQNELAYEIKDLEPKVENPYPRIFTNGKAFELFEYWHEQVPKRTQLAEYSFIYRSMIKDGYIHENLRSTEFLDFLDKNYEVTLTEIKTYDLCKGGNKPSRYSTAIRLFKL